MSAMSAAASQASTRGVPFSPAEKTFGGSASAGKGATPYAFAGEPIAMEQPAPHPFTRFPPTPIANTFARSRSPVAYRPGAASATCSGGTLPPMAQLASPQMTHRSGASPLSSARRPMPVVALVAHPAPQTSRAPSCGSSVVESARNSARRSTSYESLDGRLPGRYPVQRMPSPLIRRTDSHQSMPSMPTAQVGPVPVPVEAVPTPKGPPPQTQLAQPREPVVQTAQPKTPESVPQQPSPCSVQTQQPQQQRQPPAAAAAAGIEQLLPQTPLPSMTGMAEGGVAVTQLLHEVLHEVRNIKRFDHSKHERRPSATSPDAVGTPPVALVLGTPGSKDARDAEEWKVKCQELTKKEQELQEQVRELSDWKDRLEAKTKEQDQEHADTAKKAAEQVKQLEDQKESLESELQAAQRSSQARVALEQQIQSLIAQDKAQDAQAKQREDKLTSHLNDAAQATQRLEEEKRAARIELEATQEQLERSRQVEHEMQQVQRRCQELERSDQELQVQVRTLNGLKVSLTSQMEERERELANRVSAAVEQARRAEGEKQAREEEVQQARLMVDQTKRQAQHAVERSREELRELQARSAHLEEQLRQVGDMPRMLEQEKQAMESNMQWNRRQQQEFEKENAMLRKTVWELEHQVRQEQAMPASLAPGDFFRMMKAYEDESVCFENGRLKKELQRALCELDACQRTIHEQVALIKDLSKRASIR